MISAGVEGRLPYMTYPEPWRGPPKQPPEFLRPAPKPLPSARYNGVTNQNQNGTRLVPTQRPTTKYPSPPAVAPVNLTQPNKEEMREEIVYNAYSSYMNAQHFGPYHTNPYVPYPHNYTSILRPSFVPPPPLSPLETYAPTTPTPNTGATASYLTPPSAYSPPSKPGQSVLRDKRPSLPPSFKIPSGKEGSRKHIILTRPEDDITRKRISTIIPSSSFSSSCSSSSSSSSSSSPHSPGKLLNNNTVPLNFAKGCLIQLVNGELKRVEDMRTEDFISSAERSPELRLEESTVVKIEENSNGNIVITLSYNQRRTQVEVTSLLEHPYFVYGQGWASCNPERTLQTYGLKVHRLQVGDILVSLTPREKFSTTILQPPPPSSLSRTSTIITTATTTEMTVRPICSISKEQINHINNNNNNNSSSNSNNQTLHKTLLYATGLSLVKNNQQSSSSNLNNNNSPSTSHLNNNNNNSNIIQQRTISPDSLARKRRWSAPDQICDEDDPTTLITRRLKKE